jgi:hypothetical protein
MTGEDNDRVARGVRANSLPIQFSRELNEHIKITDKTF